MIRRALFVIAVVLTAACSVGPDPETALQQAWRWRPPPLASVGMPAGDRSGAFFTWGHQRLVHLDSRGTLQWDTELVGLRDVAPLVLADMVVAGTDSGAAAFDRATGRRLWEADLGDRGNTPVVGAHGRVVVTTWELGVFVLSRGAGAVEQVIALPGPSLGPAAAAGTTAIASWDDGLRAGVVGFDVRTGAVIWQVGVPADGVSSPAIAGDRAVVVVGDAHVVALDIATGGEVWRRPTAGAGSPEVPPYAGADLVVADRLGQLLGLTLQGQVRWRVPGRGAAVRGGPVAVGDVVALPVDDGRFLVRAGTSVRTIDPAGRVSGVGAGPDGTLLVATREADQNSLVAYRPG